MEKHKNDGSSQAKPKKKKDVTEKAEQIRQSARFYRELASALVNQDDEHAFERVMSSMPEHMSFEKVMKQILKNTKYLNP